MIEKYQELINNIRGKTIKEIVADRSNNNGFDIVFTDGSTLELYAKEIGWVLVEKEG